MLGPFYDKCYWSFVKKQFLFRPITGPKGSWSLRLPEFLENWYMKVVRLSALAPAAFIPQEIFLVLISARGWVNPRAIVRTEGLWQWKIPVTPSRIETATFRLVSQCLNQMRHCVFPEFLLNIPYRDIVDICQQEEIRMLTNKYVSDCILPWT